MITFFAIGITYAFAAAVQPGPFQAYIISQALTSGWRRTWPAAFAPLLSDGPIAIAALSFLSFAPRWFLYALQCAGGLFLLFLAFLAARTWKNYDRNRMAAQSGGQGLLKAAAVNMLNPNPYLGWSLVMGPLFLKGWRESPIYGVVLLLGFYGAMILATMGIIALSSKAGNYGPRVNRGLIGVSALTLVFFAFYEIWQGIHSVIA
jgi:threonine/homoserine/homoserine lactone efflux protein